MIHRYTHLFPQGYMHVFFPETQWYLVLIRVKIVLKLLSLLTYFHLSCSYSLIETTGREEEVTFKCFYIIIMSFFECRPSSWESRCAAVRHPWQNDEGFWALRGSYPSSCCRCWPSGELREPGSSCVTHRQEVVISLSLYGCFYPDVCLCSTYLWISSTFSMILELSPCRTSSQACQKHKFSASRETER